jgi:hypothetical protein
MITALGKVRNLVHLAWDHKVPKVFMFHDCLPEVFSRYIELLVTRRFRVIAGHGLMERVASPSEACRKEVVLTFDDGRRNCWTVIFPLLKKYGIPATFFIIPERVRESQALGPNLEDYWAGRVSWENLYVSHRREPYLTWGEIEAMHASGLVEFDSHSLRHDVVAAGSDVIDFQHPGVYEVPVYFDEWVQAGAPAPDSIWGVPIYERAWSPLTANVYVPRREMDAVMNRFVREQGGFLFFKKKKWRHVLRRHWKANRSKEGRGLYKRNDGVEDLTAAIVTSRERIRQRLKVACDKFSLPLYAHTPEVDRRLEDAGYICVMAGPDRIEAASPKLTYLRRVPGFWLQALSIL